MINFKIINKNDFSKYSKELFKILAENMSMIVPTGNTYEEDYQCWFQHFHNNVANENTTTILILNDEKIIGFFHYSVKKDVFYMGEIQLFSDYQGKNNIFRDLYGFVLPSLPKNIIHVESYANKLNVKSNNILNHLGLKIIGENKSCSGYRYRGDIVDLLEWYNHIK